jgi:hypothetical protein
MAKRRKAPRRGGTIGTLKNYQKYKGKGAKTDGFFKGWHHTTVFGKTTNLSFPQFASKLLSTNELVPPSKKKTDAEICAEIVAEFGDRHHYSRDIQNWKRGQTRPISAIRSRYNQGLFDRWFIPPEKRSFSYNEQGLIRNPYSAYKPLPAKQLREVLKSHANKRAKKIAEVAEHFAEIQDAQRQAMADDERRAKLKKRIRRRKSKYIEKNEKLRAEGYKTIPYSQSDEAHQAKMELMLLDHALEKKGKK